MTGLIGYIVTFIVSIAAGYFLTYLQPKSNLHFWDPHSFFFNIKDKHILLYTRAITLQNMGRKTANKIEIIFNKKPDFYDFSPQINFEVKENDNTFTIIIDHLGAKEFITLQMLSYITDAPTLLNIRCDSGQAKQLNFQITKAYPKWFNIAVLISMLVGAGFLLYWIIQAITFISEKIL